MQYSSPCLSHGSLARGPRALARRGLAAFVLILRGAWPLPRPDRRAWKTLPPDAPSQSQGVNDPSFHPSRVVYLDDVSLRQAEF